MCNAGHPLAVAVCGGRCGRRYRPVCSLKSELVFDPFDLTSIEVRWHGRPMGTAIPQRIGRHVHAKARPDETTPPAPVRTGIDYLHLVEAQHAADLAERVQYSQLPETSDDPQVSA